MAYPSDLTDTQWQCVEKILEDEMLHRTRAWPLRSILDAIFYVSKGGIQWRMMPLDFPPWHTVYYYYRRWRHKGFWDLLHDCLHKKVSVRHGKAESPSVGIIDSQTVKTVQQGGQRGYDAAKRVKGRKRHLAVDTLGLMLAVIVHRADIGERQGGKYLLLRIASRMADFSRLRVFFADQGYGGQRMRGWVSSTFGALGWRLQIINRIHRRAFVSLPQRWIVERTFGCFNLYRRLSRTMNAAPKAPRP